VLKKLCDLHDIDTIYFNHEYPIGERDDQVTMQLHNRGAVHTYHEQLVLAPGMVLSKQKNIANIHTI
jgi:deoxyribodipyrimidine photolyase